MWWPFRSKKQPIEVIPHASVFTLKGSKVTVTLVESKYFSPVDLLKLKKALAVICYVVNLDEFKDRVLRVAYTTTSDNAAIIYQHILNANEQQSGDDHEIDLSLEYYNSWYSKVIGYGLPTDAWIWLNWKYHLYFKSYETAGNIFHEWLHKIGYDHSSASDLQSVPYSLGYLMEELGKKYQEQAMHLIDSVELDLV